MKNWLDDQAQRVVVNGTPSLVQRLVTSEVYPILSFITNPKKVMGYAFIKSADETKL